jgi:hypothetical protein
VVLNKVIGKVAGTRFMSRVKSTASLSAYGYLRFRKPAVKQVDSHAELQTKLPIAIVMLSENHHVPT